MFGYLSIAQEEIVQSLVGKVLRIVLHISLRGLKVISLETKTIQLPVDVSSLQHMNLIQCNPRRRLDLIRCKGAAEPRHRVMEVSRKIDVSTTLTVPPGEKTFLFDLV